MRATEAVALTTGADRIAKLIAGPKAFFICDECVRSCNEIIQGETPPEETG